MLLPSTCCYTAVLNPANRSSIGSLEANVLSALSKLGTNGHRIEETASRTEQKFDQLYTLVLRLGQQNEIRSGVHGSIPRLPRIASKIIRSRRTMQLRIQHRKPRAQKRVRENLAETAESSHERARILHWEQKNRMMKTEQLSRIVRQERDGKEKMTKFVTVVTVIFLPLSLASSLLSLGVGKSGGPW